MEVTHIEKHPLTLFVQFQGKYVARWKTLPSCPCSTAAERIQDGSWRSGWLSGMEDQSENRNMQDVPLQM